MPWTTLLKISTIKWILVISVFVSCLNVGEKRVVFVNTDSVPFGLASWCRVFILSALIMHCMYWSSQQNAKFIVIARAMIKVTADVTRSACVMCPLHTLLWYYILSYYCIFYLLCCLCTQLVCAHTNNIKPVFTLGWFKVQVYRDVQLESASYCPIVEYCV